MSSRHRSQEVTQPAKADVRAHARGERHRINTELQAVAQLVSSGLEPEDTHEPGAAWKPIHHHDAEKAKTQAAAPRRVRHWKLKDWKRRTAARRARAIALRPALEEV
jgi:hypothetical protein